MALSVLKEERGHKDILNKGSQNELLRFRVNGSEGINYMSKAMSNEDIIERRAVIRRILINSSFNNSPNNFLDSIRIENTEQGFIVEDPQGYETIIGYKMEKAKD